MESQAARRDTAPKDLSLRDLAIFVFATTGFIFANVEVVRALDFALDVIHR